MPSTGRRVTSWRAAVAHYLASGSPKRPEAEVAAIFEQACQPCDRFNGKSCTLCGCAVNKSGAALRNKIRMATEVCPLGKWGDFPFGQPGPFTKPSIRHLLYHVCALDRSADPDEVWRQNVRQVCRRWSVFNGRRIVAIVTGDAVHSPERVAAEFTYWGGRDFETIVMPMDRELREVQTFPSLLEALAPGCRPEPAELSQQAFFYAHTKGNSTAGNRQGATYWRNVMYKHLLDRADECMERLTHFPAVGTHRMIWGDQRTPYPSGLQVGRWMFAGTFYWLRMDRVFGDPRWRDVPRDRYGAEAFPALLFGEHEAHSMFQVWAPYRYPSPNPYRPGTYHQDRIEDEPLPS